MHADRHLNRNKCRSIYLPEAVHSSINLSDRYARLDNVRIMNFHWVGHSFNKPAGEEALVVVSSSDFARVSLTL